MVAVAIGSIGGAPGATALALVLAEAWPGPCVVVEADPDGGRLAARLGLGIRPGLTELAAASRRADTPAPSLMRFAQPVGSSVTVVPCHPAAEQVHALLRSGGAAIGAWCARCTEHDVLVDVGRLRPASPTLPILQSASRRVVVVRGEPEDVVALVHRRELLGAIGGVEVVLVGGTYRRRDVAAAIPWPIVAEMPTRRPGRATRRIVQQLAEAVAA